MNSNSVGVVTTPPRTPERKSRPHAREHRLAAAVGVEALEVEPQCRARGPRGGDPRAGPGRRTAVVHLPEAALQSRGLRGTGGRPRAWVAGAHREVAEDDPRRQVGEALVQRRAERALEVGVLDHDRRAVGAADVIVVVRSGDRCGAEFGHGDEPRQASRPSKIRLAPGRSAGRRRLVAPAHGQVGVDDHQRALGKASRVVDRRTPCRPRPWARSPRAARSSRRGAP